MISRRQHAARPQRPLDIEAGPGGFVLDAHAIAERFGMSAETMRSLMSRQLMRGVVEKGEGTDAGTWRLTLRYGNRMWRAILMDNGGLREETVGTGSIKQNAKGHVDCER